jgi:hypothetical protein
MELIQKKNMVGWSRERGRGNLFRSADVQGYLMEMKLFIPTPHFDQDDTDTYTDCDSYDQDDFAHDHRDHIDEEPPNTLLQEVQQDQQGQEDQWGECPILGLDVDRVDTKKYARLQRENKRLQMQLAQTRILFAIVTLMCLSMTKNKHKPTKSTAILCECTNAEEAGLVAANEDDDLSEANQGFQDAAVEDASKLDGNTGSFKVDDVHKYDVVTLDVAQCAQHVDESSTNAEDIEADDEENVANPDDAQGIQDTDESSTTAEDIEVEDDQNIVAPDDAQCIRDVDQSSTTAEDIEDEEEEINLALGDAQCIQDAEESSSSTAEDMEVEDDQIIIAPDDAQCIQDADDSSTTAEDIEVEDDQNIIAPDDAQCTQHANVSSSSTAENTEVEADDINVAPDGAEFTQDAERYAEDESGEMDFHIGDAQCSQDDVQSDQDAVYRETFAKLQELCQKGYCLRNLTGCCNRVTQAKPPRMFHLEVGDKCPICDKVLEGIPQCHIRVCARKYFEVSNPFEFISQVPEFLERLQCTSPELLKYMYM